VLPSLGCSLFVQRDRASSKLSVTSSLQSTWLPRAIVADILIMMEPPTGLPVVLKIAYSDTWSQSHVFVTVNWIPITKLINVRSQNNKTVIV